MNPKTPRATAEVTHSVAFTNRTHCGIPLTTVPLAVRITGRTINATCPDCKTVRLAHGWTN